MRVYANKIERNVSFLINDEEHPKKESFLTFLNGIASIFDKLDVRIDKTAFNQYSPLTFEIASDDIPTGILFSGIPGGHEFNSLILGTLQAGGSKINLDGSLINQIKQIDTEIDFETVISIENCQMLFKTSISLNNKIHTIDSISEVVKTRDIQSVPSVFINSEMIASTSTSGR